MANESETKKTLKLGGLPWWQALCVVLISVACMALGVQSSSIAGTLCSAFGLGGAIVLIIASFVFSFWM